MYNNQNIYWTLSLLIFFASSISMANDKVAEVYGRDIYRSEISFTVNEKESLKKAKSEDEIQQLARLIEDKRLAAIIFEQARAIILGVNSYKPAPKEIESYVSTITESLSKKGHIQNLTKEQLESFQESQEVIAYEFIEQWNVNKRLFEIYGGRVIFQQVGPEPIDAYKDFIRENISSGKVTIIASEFKKILTFPDENIHNLYIEKKNIKHAFESPMWKN